MSHCFLRSPCPPRSMHHHVVDESVFQRPEESLYIYSLWCSPTQYPWTSGKWRLFYQNMLSHPCGDDPKSWTIFVCLIKTKTMDPNSMDLPVEFIFFWGFASLTLKKKRPEKNTWTETKETTQKHNETIKWCGKNNNSNITYKTICLLTAEQEETWAKHMHTHPVNSHVCKDFGNPMMY